MSASEWEAKLVFESFGSSKKNLSSQIQLDYFGFLLERERQTKTERAKKNNNTMLAISNWTKNGLSHQTETKTEARKSYNERKTDRPEPLSDLNH